LGGTSATAEDVAPHSPRLLQDLVIARGDGRYTKLLTQFAKTDVPVLDD